MSQSISDGDQVNYFAEATGGVSYEWSNIPAGMSVNSANERNLIGSPTGGPGTYNITLKAINYFGTDTETVVLTVTSSYANTKSIDFENQDYLGANASLLDAILGRASNGAGSSDAWTIHLWFKGSTNSTGQTIFYFGDNDTTNGGHINLRFIGGTDTLRLQYGTTNNYIRWQSTNTALAAGVWKHIMITYDGGTTGSSQADLSDYYSRFTVFIDGVDVTSAGAWSHNNYGYTGGIDPDNLRVGRYASGNYMRDGCRVDELAIWAGDESANIADIYNSGTPHDLDLLASSPDHWWRMGDGDTYPTIQDNVGTAHFVMYNMTVADIVNDTP
ncbi:MAG: LamG domain-containing protein [Epibacterium sp.]|nr:LamG domain-containing protein [Epibacterium sp.]NQX73829.1 LamG domain-containing protein [Epibacterium sp.]